ncbi:MAG: metal-sensitive transcriptional regulator [Cyanobacteria bacterium P01_H01_bin.150]
MNGTSKENEPILSDSTDNTTKEHNHNHRHSIHDHVHSEESLRKIVNRLSRIEGHVRGIKTMVQQNTPCPDVLLQIAAVRGAIDKVARIVLDEHLTECVARAAKDGNIDAEMEELKAALDRFLP